ncbi:MAG: NUDIX domain-containing protein [Actinomycetota bacterium]|nr:NUDIX domain-containing protein [Actinomycetota bacterium]
MTIKHATASTFTFARVDGVWRIGLILHPLLGRMMVPGGHVEADETAPEAARREVAEETGLNVRFLPSPAAAVPPDVAATGRIVSLPWWIMEQPIDADNHVAGPHFHIDHLFVAVADDIRPVREAAHPFGWYRADELAGLTMFADTRSLAGQLFPAIGDLAAGPVESPVPAG